MYDIRLFVSMCVARADESDSGEVMAGGSIAIERCFANRFVLNGALVKTLFAAIGWPAVALTSDLW